MTERRKSRVSARKSPKQSRANDLVKAVLEAAVQVLRTEGAARFTTARVAERAGVSVGSLYQYFPNKAAILFRLQSDEWRVTGERLAEILQDRSRPTHERVRSLVRAFLQSECEEAQVRIALGGEAPAYRDEPEADTARASASHIIRDFIGETLPRASAAEVALAADLIESTLTQVGSAFSSVERTGGEIADYADAMAEMFCAYVDRLAERSARPEAPAPS